MILDRITLTNFRCFEGLDQPLDRHLNVFVGGNGAGKSTILQAIAIGLAPVLSALPFEKRPKVPSIQQGDIHLVEADQSSPWASIEAGGELDPGEPATWLQAKSLRSGGGSAPKTDLMAVRRYAERLTARHNAGEPYRLPVLAFYGTDRAVDVPVYRLRDQALPPFFRRLASLEDALDPSTSLRHSIRWFDFLESRELRQMRDKEDRGGLSEVEAVRRAIGGMIDGIENPRIDGTTGRFAVDYPMQDGKKVKLYIDQLSDGYQVLLGVVMDFALRLALARPSDDQGDPLAAEAILIIDEVDLHLHPAWQQEVVPRLRATFPNTQIILTTHSPQVLSAVDAKHIRQIRRVGETTTTTIPPYQTRGVASGAVLATAMDVDPIPPVDPARWASDYRAAIQSDRDETPEARELWGRLVDHFEAKHPIIAELEALRRFQEFKRRNHVGAIEARG